MLVNKVILIGNVGKDFDVRYLDIGIVVVIFLLVIIDCVYMLQNGIQVFECMEWYNIVLWRGLV